MNKDSLIQQLDEIRAQTEATLQGIDPETVIYEDNGWKVKDIIAHLAAWEEIYGRSLRACGQGGEYKLANYTTDDEYNDYIYHQRKDYPYERSLADWAAARNEVKAALLALDDELLGGQLECAWPETMKTIQFVRHIIDHEDVHRREFVEIAGKG